eukprot:COSAG05_NODE_360_length_10798_cov_219.943359_1_plen_80_part_00
MGVFIISTIILVYWSECNLPAAVGTVDGMVTDRFYMCYTSDLTAPSSEPSSTPALLLILSKQKIFRYFMHMRAKTICGF